jgi:hypothetical protein
MKPLLILALCSTTLPGQEVWRQIHAVDGLGRELCSAEAAGPLRADRTVCLFYFLWLGRGGNNDKTPINVQELLTKHPEAGRDPFHPAWKDSLNLRDREGDAARMPRPQTSTMVHWNEPMWGYYRADDPWVQRKNMQLLTLMGVDALFFDATNLEHFQEESWLVMQTVESLQAQGTTAPLLGYYTNTKSGERMQRIYETFYRDGAPVRHPNTWYRWDGKPVLVGLRNEATPELKTFFALKQGWPNGDKPTPEHWPWMSGWKSDAQPVYPSKQFPQGEITCVSVAQVGGMDGDKFLASTRAFLGKDTALGRGYAYGVRDHSRQALHHGANVGMRWAYALAQDPRVVFVTGWNEWVAGRWLPKGGSQPCMYDLCNDEYSRDAEPMRGGWGDAYAMQLADAVRKYRGAPAVVPANGPHTIDIAKPFSQWDAVLPVFRDFQGDTAPRDHAGYGALRYTDQTGRNDLTHLQVALDAQTVAFHARCAAPLVAGERWMRLLIDSDGDSRSGWQGYDHQVRREGETLVLLRRAGAAWERTTTTVAWRAEGAQLHLALPRAALGGVPGELRFQWTDAVSDEDDALSFYTSGDAAPDGRFAYVWRPAGWQPTTATPLPAKAATASGGSNAAAVIDADATSAWSNGPLKTAAAESWIAIDLGEARAVGGVLLTPRVVRRAAVGWPRDWRIEASDDGTQWKAVPGASVTWDELPGPFGQRTLRFAAPITTRHLRWVSMRHRYDEGGTKFFHQLAGFSALPAAGTTP